MPIRRRPSPRRSSARKRSRGRRKHTPAARVRGVVRTLLLVVVVGGLLAGGGLLVLRSARALPVGVDLSVLASWDTIEQSLPARAFVVRDEQILQAPAAGTLRAQVAHGERVRPGQVLVELVDLADRRETEAQLAELDRRIRVYEGQERNTRERWTQESIRAELSYKTALAGLGRAVLAGPLTAFGETWSQLEASAKARAVADAKVADSDRHADELQRQREQLLVNLEVPGTELPSHAQALVSFVFDGLEGTRVSDLLALGPAQFLSLRESRQIMANGLSVGAGEPICKLVNPAGVKLVTLLPTREVDHIVAGDRLVVRFPGGGEAVLRSQVLEVGAGKANGTTMVVIETEGLISGLVADRWTSCELVFSSRSGVVIPRAALASRDGESGVLALSRTSAYFRPVTVLAKSGNRLLVQGISAGTAVARYPWIWSLLGRIRSSSLLQPDLASRRIEL